jgi:hypothetical protein
MEPGQADEIQELIRREKEEAERSFEGARFDARLFERIGKAEGRRPEAWPVFLTKPGPVVTFFVLILAFAGLLFFRTFSPSPLRPTIRAMSAAFEKSGAGLGTSGQDRTAQRIATAEYTELGWAIKGVLYACKRQALGDISLTDALSRVFLDTASRAASGRDGEGTLSPRVEAPKLRTDEDYRMFFTGFLKKLEEV